MSVFGVEDPIELDSLHFNNCLVHIGSTALDLLLFFVTFMVPSRLNGEDVIFKIKFVIA